MALETTNLKGGYLLIERQAEKLTKYQDGYITKVLKGRTKRKTPHWMIDKDETYSILSLLLIIHYSNDLFPLNSFSYFLSILYNYSVYRRMAVNFSKKVIV